MCGIAGWFRRTGETVNPALVEAQCDAIFHRGPDDSGVLVDGDFGFGMRRLSILDVAGGHQPMRLGPLAIVFNGEIFNHLDLRAELEPRGYEFATHSDTETILAAYHAWGDQAWGRLEGMFTVAIWNRHSRQLTLARDPLGIKPLYVSEQAGGVAFASELKALRMLPGLRFDVCERSVHDFFSFGHVRKPRTIFEQVGTLNPGHFMVVPAQGKPSIHCYWKPVPRGAQQRSEADWTEEMRTMVEATVQRHLQSDVEVGAFLSGGIDSSAVLAAMRRASGQRFKAFTIGYPGAAIDETAAARQIADHLDCEHVVLPLEVGRAVDVLPTVQRCFDEPFADMAAVPTWYASKLAAEQVKVVLCGEGGDELFAGYKRHRNAALIERYRPLIRAGAPLLNVIGQVPTFGSVGAGALRQHARRAAEFARLPDGYQQFFAATQISQRSVRERVLASGAMRRYEEGDSYARLEQEYFGGAGHGSALEQFMFADLTVNMPSAMLTRLDRASMAHSLEARVPFLSHRFVDWAMTVPSALKLKGQTGKYLLRHAIAPWLPRDILKRPKQGFQMPLGQWFRGDFGRFAEEVWNDGGAKSAGYLDESAVTALFAEHRAGAADHGRMLYAIAVFSLWWQDQRTAQGSTAAPSQTFASA